MKLKIFPIIATLASVLFLAGAVAVTMNGIKPKGGMDGHPPPSSGDQNTPVISAKTIKAQAPSVAVLKAEENEYQANIKGFGEATAHFQITYSAEVSGRIEKLSDDFEVGKIIKQGTVLAQIENTSYQQAVAQAKSNLAQSKLDYLEEQRTGEQARLEWKRSGLEGEPNSDLVLRKPQLAAAQAALEEARVSLQKAQQDLNKTMIKAPFDALIITRDIQPGSYLQVGTTIATLYSTDRVEIAIPLSSKQWQSLPEINNQQLLANTADKWSVTLTDSEGRQHWQGYVIRSQQHLDSDSRQRSLIVAVDLPFQQSHPLFPGTFVQADIIGRSLTDTWQLPASAISQQGDIWFVDKKNQLNKVAANKLFERDGDVYVAARNDINDAFIVKRPLNNYVVGMQVIPELAE